jgi:sec-independent protein translocase protein TatC
MALDQIDVDKMELDAQGQVKEMSFLEHLEELRWHIIRSLIAIMSAGIILFIFQRWLFDTVIFGPTRKDFLSYRVICDLSNSIGLGDIMCFNPPDFAKIAIGFGEPFIMSIKVSFVMGFIISFPYVLWEVWKFIKPGLYAKERKAARGMVAICSFLFLLGVLFGYYIIAPFAVNFLAGYNISMYRTKNLNHKRNKENKASTGLPLCELCHFQPMADTCGTIRVLSSVISAYGRRVWFCPVYRSTN